jgi:hypothetical protein
MHCYIDYLMAILDYTRLDYTTPGCILWHVGLGLGLGLGLGYTRLDYTTSGCILWHVPAQERDRV